MPNFDASTPQLEAVKSLMDAFASLNLGELMTLLSKNYQYEAFNGATTLTKLDREAYAKVIQGLSAGVTKMDVSIQQRSTIFIPTD